MDTLHTQRITAALAALILAACGSEAEQHEAELLRQEQHLEVLRTRAAALQSDIAQMEQERRTIDGQREATRTPFASPTTTEQPPPPAHPTRNPIAAYEERPLVAYVNNRPPECSGALCVALTNTRSYPIAELIIDGSLVVIRNLSPERGAYIWPGDRAYIRLLRPDEHTIQATLVDSIATPDGRAIPVPSVRIEGCSYRSRFPSGIAKRIGMEPVDLDFTNCG